MLSEETKKAILDLQKKYPVKRSALIPALHLAQSEKGYLSLETQTEVANLFQLDVNEVHSVVTFYDMFFERPVGKHIIHICKNASCMLRGCDDLINKVCTKLKTKPGQVTEDGEFTVIPSECLGACDRAPMMLVDEKVVGPVKDDEIDDILKIAQKSPGHPSPIFQEDKHG